MNTHTQPIRTQAETALVEQFESVKEHLPGSTVDREKAFHYVQAAGLPHRRIEEWKYTDLRARMQDAKPLAQKPDEKALEDASQRLPALDNITARAVFVNGVFAPELSQIGTLPKGVEMVSLAQAFADHHPLVVQLGSAHAPLTNTAVALNAAFAAEGVLIRIAKDAKVDAPLHLAFVQNGDGHASYHRVLVVVEEGANVTLFESHHGNGPHQTNTHVEILAADKARVRHVKLQAECLQTQHLATLSAQVGQETAFVSTTVARGAMLARQQMFMTCAGENAHVDLSGVTLVAGSRHLDTTLVVDHAVPHGTSRERFKAVLDGEARSVFQGKIIVRQIAQKTDGQMKADTLMLSEGCEADLKPELEIFADDVVCAHGATCGALNDDYLFYLKARGIPQAEAEAMLVEAFASDVLDDVEHEGLRGVLQAVVTRWLDVRN
jgi:Fe-S cluster assembly protein SufD